LFKIIEFEKRKIFAYQFARHDFCLPDDVCSLGLDAGVVGVEVDVADDLGQGGGHKQTVLPKTAVAVFV
jgi:hypothetical protein